MSTTLSVKLPADDPRAADLHRAVLASVPSRFHITDAPVAAVYVISGQPSGWVERARQVITDGARAMLLTRLQPVALDHLKALEDSAVEAAAIVDSVVSSASTDTLTGALLAQLAVVRPLIAGADLAPVTYHPDSHYVLAGQAGAAAVTLPAWSPPGRRGLAVGHASRWTQ